jgi:hypothetical protein
VVSREGTTAYPKRRCVIAYRTGKSLSITNGMAVRHSTIYAGLAGIVLVPTARTLIPRIHVATPVFESCQRRDLHGPTFDSVVPI